MSRHNHGFTLLELMIVVSLVLFLTGAIVPIYGATMSAVRTEGAIKTFLTTLRFTQEKAVAESVEYRLCINQKNQSYWVERLKTMKGLEKIFEPVDDRFGVRQTLPRALTFDKLKMKESTRGKEFYLDCLPNGGCTRAAITLLDGPKEKKTVIETLGYIGKVKVTHP